MALTNSLTQNPTPPYFITGLPRTRTAWLAAWLSVGEKLCLHDCEPHPHHDARISGYSGPELLMQYEELRRAFPGAKWMIVNRDIGEALKSFTRWASSGVPHGFDLEGMFHRRLELLKRLDGLRVEFNALSDVTTAREIWEYLHPPGAPGANRFDARRFFAFDRLNIQQRRPSWL
ncbi:MAG TPA: hypothetical protein VMF08_13585 [Candidatus Sulfotelmatobacter sp.]|nr:hypothetical protein [Candidatus Sulfotelmatobacter sp.]